MDLYAWHAPGTFLKGRCVAETQFHATFLGYNALILMNLSVLDALELTMLAARLVADLGDCRMLPTDKSCARDARR